MREIKFRAWDKDYEKMMEIHSIVFRQDELIIDCYDEKDNENWLSENNERVVLMQYTGLKDKNGVEIYEGDIIRTTFPHCTAVVVWEEDTVRYISYTIESERKIVYVDRVDRNDKSAVEIIGNIYENPELLEVK